MTSLIRHFINLKFSFIFPRAGLGQVGTRGGNSINPLIMMIIIIIIIIIITIIIIIIIIIIINNNTE